MYYFIYITLCVATDKSDTKECQESEDHKNVSLFVEPSIQFTEFLWLMYCIQINDRRRLIGTLENWKKSGIHPDTFLYNGFTLLAFAISNGNIDLINILIDYGSSLSIKLSNGLYPIDYAKTDDVIKHLVSNGANINS